MEKVVSWFLAIFLPHYCDLKEMGMEPWTKLCPSHGSVMASLSLPLPPQMRI